MRATGLSPATESLTAVVYSLQGRALQQLKLARNNEGSLECYVVPDAGLPPGLYVIKAGPGQSLATRLLVVNE
ncbi:MAG: hypothetical protein KatS3mg032_0823 [Cyclobacteriaceae bacterium]|nr:MAG: hypothetical protein KatS3mg032_0823 [Cyclobacteriaceae bacterium]